MSLTAAQTAALAQLKDAVDSVYASGLTAEHVMGMVAERSGAQLHREHTSINQFLSLFGVCSRINEHIELQVATALYDIYECGNANRAPTTLVDMQYTHARFVRLVQDVCSAGIEHGRARQVLAVHHAIETRLCGVHKPKLDKGLDLLVVALGAARGVLPALLLPPLTTRNIKLVFTQVKDWTYIKPKELLAAVDRLIAAALKCYKSLFERELRTLIDAHIIGGVECELLVVLPGCRIAKALPVYEAETLAPGVEAPITVMHGTDAMRYVFTDDAVRAKFLRVVRRTSRAVNA